MFQNLGIALGSGVDEWHRQQEESRKQTAEERAALQFKQQQEQYTRQQKIRDTRDKLIKEYQDFDGYLKGMDGVADDKLADYVRQGVTRYNTNPYYKNGLFGQVVEHKGAPHIAHGSFQDQNLEYIPVTREHAKQAGAAMQQMLREQLAMVDSDKMEGFLDHREKMGLEGRKVGAEEDKVLAVKGHYKDIADHYRWVEGQPQLRELGNGQVGMFKGEKYLGAYGPARPILGHGGGSGAGGKTDWVPMGEDSDGQVVFFNKKAVVDPRNPDSMFLRPDGKPVSDVRGLYRKLTGAAVDKPQPAIPTAAVTEFAKTYFNADPKTQQMLKLQNPVLASLVTGGSTELKPGAMAGGKPPVSAVAPTPQSRPTADPIAAFRTNRGVDLTSNDPMVQLQAMQEMGQLVADRDRRLGLQPRLTGKEWYYTPQTNK